MSKAEPTVQKYMTCQPQSIAFEETVSEAQKLMAEFKIRHLPVLKDGKIYGVISERDIKTACGLVGADPLKMLTGDICHDHPYQVEPDALLHEVVEEMAEKHYGCAIVSQNGKLVGIYTTVDACRTISDILNQRFHTH